MAFSRDEKLRRLLPARDSTYSFSSLSKAEMDALEEALSDGFGDIGAKGLDPMPLPARVRSGLLQHDFYCPADLEYDSDEWDDAFWDSASSVDGAIAPYEMFPLGFVPRRLRLYFQNQIERFKHRMIGERPELAEVLAEDDEWYLDYLAGRRLYQKPWYEHHAIQFLDWIENSARFAKDEKTARFFMLVVTPGTAGQFGRLVEQYYWRFRYEEAAVTGAGARKGASAGGQAKARLHLIEHAAWQRAAAEIWTRRPELSKISVAESIRRRLAVARTAKHIARYIIRP